VVSHSLFGRNQVSPPALLVEPATYQPIKKIKKKNEPECPSQRCGEIL